MNENKLKLLIAVHSHQPVGNFEWVYNQAYESAYQPFLDILERHPKIRLALHYSGSLIDWLEEERPEFLDKLKGLVDKDQVEIISGGYYEPILPLIPDRDKLGQIGLLSSFITERLGCSPKGAWVTERVWEPQLVRPLAESGIRYVAVDDFHFKLAGMNPESLSGYYVSEEEGQKLFIFPGSEKLRYLIPFKQPEETIEYLRSLAAKKVECIAYADDGEKFGLWPGTYEWVYHRGWLENFFAALEANLEWIELLTFAEYIDTHGPTGRVYLPCASYREMLEWSGGFFRNFLVKYPESNIMHKKMLYVSEKVNRVESIEYRVKSKKFAEREAKLTAAKRELYMGQCSCAYWHGVFGGLYLNHLRSSVYSHLIEAERIADELAGKEVGIESTVTDFDKDGNDEVIINADKINLYLAPSRGGALFELDYKPKSLNLYNAITRRYEPYHEKVKHFAPQGNSISRAAHLPSESEPTSVKSIHDILSVKERDLEEYLNYDQYQKMSLIDHFFSGESSCADFAACKCEESGEFVAQPYTCEIKKSRGLRRGNGFEVKLSRQGHVRSHGATLPFTVSKSLKFTAGGEGLNIKYVLKNLSSEELPANFGVEFNISIKDSKFNTVGEIATCRKAKFHDEWSDTDISYEFDKPANIWYFPLETISESEKGVERTYQQLSLLFTWPIKLGAGDQWEVKFSQEISNTD